MAFDTEMEQTGRDIEAHSNGDDRIGQRRTLLMQQLDRLKQATEELEARLGTRSQLGHGDTRATGHDGLRSISPDIDDSAISRKSEEYWTEHNVTAHARFASAEESLGYFHWRNDQYPGYIDLLPVSGQDEAVILDYGCGPGHDLLGFSVYSRPARMIGMDVSAVSLAQAGERLALHGVDAELVKLDHDQVLLPLPDECVDYVHCSGVLMLVPDPLGTLREFHRVLKPGGRVRLMVYNFDSVWMHLYVAYILMQTNSAYRGLSLEEAFSRSTDGERCPLNQAWSTAIFLAHCEASGFAARHLGNAVSLHELAVLPRRFEPMQDPKFPGIHRSFLTKLEFDRFGIPHYQGVVAGIDGCYEVVKEMGREVDSVQVELITRIQEHQIRLKKLQDILRHA